MTAVPYSFLPYLMTEFRILLRQRITAPAN